MSAQTLLGNASVGTSPETAKGSLVAVAQGALVGGTVTFTPGLTLSSATGGFPANISTSLYKIVPFYPQIAADALAGSLTGTITLAFPSATTISVSSSVGADTGTVGVLIYQQ